MLGIDEMMEPPIDLAEELISKPLFPGPLEPTAISPLVFKILAALLAVLVVLVVVMWYHCGDEILTFLDLDATPRSPLGTHYTGGDVDVDLTGMEMDAQLLLHSIKAGTSTHAGRGSGSKGRGGAGGGKKGGRGQPPPSKSSGATGLGI